MRTRLRISRDREDKPSQTTPASLLPPSSANAVGSLLHMQQTVGNAATRRFLQGGTTSTVVRRDVAKDKPPTPATAGKPHTIIFATMATLDGKLIRGTSKHKGREGQLELQYFSQEKTGLPAGSTTQGREGKREAPKTERIAGANVTTSKDRAEFSLSKLIDAATPPLAEAAVSGTAVRMRVDFVRVDEQGRETLALSFELPEALLSHYSVGSNGPDEFETMSIQTQGMSITIPDTPAPP